MLFEYGVWNGQAWLMTVFRAIWRCATIDEAEALAVRQRISWPEFTWTVYLIGPDNLPYRGPHGEDSSV